ncbi:MAG: RNA polymerase sigma factor [Planctomycetota bacterium]
MWGSHEAFLTTEWTVIDHIRSGTSSSSASLFNDWLGKYWKPVYCYLHRKGYDNEQAKDLTQGFFQEIVLGRSLVKQADQSRGRFRTFLLTALQQYLASEHRRQSAQKRTPKGKCFSLDRLKVDIMPKVPTHFSPEESFNYAWAAQLLDKLLGEVEAKCRTEGKTLHWEVFRDRVLQPIMDNVSAPSLAEICQRHDVDNPGKVSNMIVTVNRRFRTALKRHIRRSVVQDADVDEESRELIRIFSRGSAR